MLAPDPLRPLGEPCSLGVHALDRRLVERLQHGEPRGHRDGVPVERAGVADDAATARVEHAHHVLAPADGADRKAPAERLAQADQVSLQAMVLGPCAAVAGPPAGDLVEDQQHLVRGAPVGDPVQELGLAWDHSPRVQEYLDQHRCQLPGLGFEHLQRAGEVVVGEHAHPAYHLPRHPPGLSKRVPERGPEAGHADVHEVVAAVIAALGLRDPVAAAEGARGPDCLQGRLRAGVRKTHELHCGKALADPLGQQHLVRD